MRRRSPRRQSSSPKLSSRSDHGFDIPLPSSFLLYQTFDFALQPRKLPADVRNGRLSLLDAFGLCLDVAGIRRHVIPQPADRIAGLVLEAAGKRIDQVSAQRRHFLLEAVLGLR